MIIPMNYSEVLDKLGVESGDYRRVPDHRPGKCLIIPISHEDKLIDHFLNETSNINAINIEVAIKSLIKEKIVSYYKENPNELLRALKVPVTEKDQDILEDIIND